LPTDRSTQRIVRLSREQDGTEIWLDTETGQQLTGTVERDDDIVPHPFIATATGVLTELEWQYVLVSPTYAWTAVRAANARYLVTFRTDDVQILVCTVDVPVRVAEEQRQRALDYLNRANYGMRAGNFELDPSDGEVCFRVSFDGNNATVTPQVIRVLIDTAMTMCERYFRGLMSVLFAEREPSEAIQEAESV
jgi:hypothetical protein